MIDAGQRVEEIRQRRTRCSSVLDTGGDELALVGEDIDWLLAELTERDAVLAAARDQQTVKERDQNIAALRSDEAMRVGELRQVREGAAHLRASWEYERQRATQQAEEIARLTTFLRLLVKFNALNDYYHRQARSILSKGVTKG